ncbi:TPA: hypothetical protein U2P84_002043 [Acinetobacter baumannii]|nr:hypothetical protein [Acinetobacter baumannii]
MTKFLGDTQSQEASENSVAIQAGRDLHITTSGLSYRDVREICIDLLEANFPKIREESLAISMQYVEEFGTKFFERLVKEDPDSTQEKLKDPDVQAAINTSIIHVARMTEKSHQDILCELITEKLNTSEEEENLILNDAIEVMTKITKNQMLFLVFITTLRFVSRGKQDHHRNSLHPDNKAQYDFYEKDIIEIIGDNIYEIDTYVLEYKGLIHTKNLYSYNVSLAQIIQESTGRQLLEPNSTKLLNNGLVFKINFPNLSRLLTKFGFKEISELDSLIMTPIARAIALAYLKNYYNSDISQVENELNNK